MEVDLLSYTLWNIGKIFFVVFRQHQFEDSIPVRRENFFLQAANRQHPAPDGDLPGHGEIAAHGNIGECATDTGGDGDAGRWPIFGDRALWNVHVNIDVAVEVAR